jgi:hypothetical protein
VIQRAGFALAAALGCTGCAFGDGEPFGELEATLDARYQLLPERDAGDGWQKLDNDFEVKVEALELGVNTIELEDLGVAAEGGEDEAPAAPSIVATLPVGDLDLVGGASVTLACVDSCQLPRSHLGRARLSAQRIEATGEVRDGRATPRLTGDVPFIVSAPLGVTDPDRTGLLEVELDVPVDRDESPLVHLDLVLRVDAELFDSIAFDQASKDLGGAQPLDLSAHEASLARLVSNFAETDLTATVTRRDD